MHCAGYDKICEPKYFAPYFHLNLVITIQFEAHYKNFQTDYYKTINNTEQLIVLLDLTR